MWGWFLGPDVGLAWQWWSRALGALRRLARGPVRGRAREARDRGGRQRAARGVAVLPVLGAERRAACDLRGRRVSRGRRARARPHAARNRGRCARAGARGGLVRADALPALPGDARLAGRRAGGRHADRRARDAAARAGPRAARRRARRRGRRRARDRRGLRVGRARGDRDDPQHGVSRPASLDGRRAQRRRAAQREPRRAALGGRVGAALERLRGGVVLAALAGARRAARSGGAHAASGSTR